MLFTGGIRLTEDPRFSLAGPTNSTLMVTKTFFAVKSPIIENMISGDGLGCHGQWILRVPDHGSRDRLYLAHSSCIAVILSAGRRIVFFLLFCHCCCCCCCCCPRDRLYLAHSSSVAVILGTGRNAQTFLILFVFVVVVRETVSISSTLLVSQSLLMLLLFRY